MVKYLVKMTEVATPENRNFAGETYITYHGKKNRLLCVDGTHADRWGTDIPMFGVEQCGYNRIRDAKHNYTYRHHRDWGYDGYQKLWTSTIEIVEVNY